MVQPKIGKKRRQFSFELNSLIGLSYVLLIHWQVSDVTQRTTHLPKRCITKGSVELTDVSTSWNFHIFHAIVCHLYLPCKLQLNLQKQTGVHPDETVGYDRPRLESVQEPRLLVLPCHSVEKWVPSSVQQIVAGRDLPGVDAALGSGAESAAPSVKTGSLSSWSSLSNGRNKQKTKLLHTCMYINIWGVCVCVWEKLMHYVPGQLTGARWPWGGHPKPTFGKGSCRERSGNPSRKKGDLRMRRSQMKLGREGAVWGRSVIQGPQGAGRDPHHCPPPHPLGQQSPVSCPGPPAPTPYPAPFTRISQCFQLWVLASRDAIVKVGNPR